MRLIPAPLQRWLAILLPPLAIAVCCFVMIPRHSKLRAVDKEIAAAQASVQDYLTKLKAISDLPENPRLATMPFSKQEQSDFLRDLSALCYRSGNQIVSVKALAAKRAGSEDPKKKKKAAPTTALPEGVVAIESTIVFDGPFDGLRRFLTGLERSRRMVSLSYCQITPGRGGYPTLQTSLNVIRYVDAPSLPPAPVKAAAPAAPAS